MSLLIDALREAEQRKAREEGSVQSPLGNDDPRAAEGEAEHDLPPVEAAVAGTDIPPGEGGLPHEAPAAATDLPKGGLSLDEVSEEAAASSPARQVGAPPPDFSQGAATAPGSSPDLDTGKEPDRMHAVTAPDDGSGAVETHPVQADNLFHAKEAAWKSPRRRFLLFAGAGFLVTAAVIIAYYYWNLHQIQPVALPPLAQAPAPKAAGGPLSRPRARAPAVTPSGDTVPAGGKKPATSSSVASNRQGAGRKRHAASKAAAPARKRVAKPPIQIRRTIRPPVFPLLQQAYAAFGEGRLDEARHLYAQVRRLEPDNRDALLGLAAVALRSGHLEEARRLYRRCLEIEPKDPVARAGLLSLQTAVDPVAREAGLKSLLQEAGDSAPVHFALGNLYAQQQRWAAAQAAYFRALQAAPGNADYAYNLAVSLEHLGRRREALDFYRRALQAGERSVSFDRDQAAARVRILHAVLEEEGAA
ncbi:MAG TPA: tetratricopeptide repeat protein [Gammaproteobacteria bacterium]|nr:tetratricopeptide repeat protein [Gammaproteobacteria bacterium]